MARWSSNGMKIAAFRYARGTRRSYVRRVEGQGRARPQRVLASAQCVTSKRQSRLSQACVNAPSAADRSVALFRERGPTIWGADRERARHRIRNLRMTAQMERGFTRLPWAVGSGDDNGRVVDVAVQVGQRVDRGASLATSKRCENEHALGAGMSGMVRAVHVRMAVIRFAAGTTRA